MELRTKILMNMGWALGIACMTLINIILINTNRNALKYNWWMLGISIIVLIISIIILNRKKKRAGI